jgi:hypothetical protein
VPWKILIPLALPVVIVSFFILFYMRTSHSKNDAVVLADIVDTTDDPSFASSLKLALATDFNQPGFPHVLSDAEVTESLRTIGYAPETRLTAVLAREVCRKENAKAVIVASLSKGSDDYAIDLKATGCRGSDIVAETQGRTSDKSGVLEVLNAAARQLRARIVESR